MEDYFAEGNISKDTVYNGPIKFYDVATNTLQEVVTYKTGVMDGERTGYYANGKLKFKANYIKGKQDGDTETYDSLGNLIFKQSFYYSLRVGASIKYNNNEVAHYYFYSLQNEELFQLDYDSLKTKTVEQLSTANFFFWHINKYFTAGSNDDRTELFLYVPDPPKLHFKYSLCIADSASNVRSVVKQFESKDIWSTADLDYGLLKPAESFTIKLEIENELATGNKKTTLFHKL